MFSEINKIVEDNRKGKTICFVSRGSWADPQIAYQGKLLNQFDVESIACDGKPDDYEPSNEEWQSACIDSYFAYTEANAHLDNFSASDVFSVTSIINIK